jgi:putative endonuclease
MGLHRDQSTQWHALCWRDRHIARRSWEHREGLVDGFTKRYGLKQLVYFERYDDIRDARQREQNIKHYPRAWKVRLILLNNPSWYDLYDRSI